MDAAGARAGNYADGDKFHGMAGGEKGHEHFGFDFEVARGEAQRRPRGEVNEAEAALGIRQGATGAGRKAAAHPAIDPAPHPRHGARVSHAIADDEGSTGLCGAMEEGREVGGVVLAVAIERHGPFETEAKQVVEAGLKRCAFAAVALMAKDEGAGVLGVERGVVVRAVVHDGDQGEMLARSHHERADGAVFVEAGDDGGAGHKQLI